MDVEDFKKKYEQLKDNPMYKNFCSILDTKSQVLERTTKEKQELKKQLEEVEFIVGLRQKRNLISKFDKEYDEEDKKKNPNRNYAGIMPDAEEIYKRYYAMKNQQKEFIEWLENEIKYWEKQEQQWIKLGFMKFGGEANNKIIFKKVLSKYKEIIGGRLNE